MLLQECYKNLGGNAEDVLRRLRSERLVQKFMFRFLEDNSYTLLKDSMKSQNYPEAFRAAHTIKGVCQNLGFTQLEKSSSALCEALRHDNISEANDLVQQVELDYQQTIQAIRSFQQQLNR